jgi:uncharacterized membrane protein YcaP (DUF421 family)
MDVNELVLTAARASLLYFFLLFIVRLLGKREVGNITAFDLIVAFMLGEVTDEIIFGDVSLAKGFLAIGVVALWHLANSWGSYKSEFIDRLTGSKATLLVEHGQIDQKGLAKERMSEEELWSALRLQGIEDITQIKSAMLEPHGQVSVIKEEWAEPIQKRDLPEATEKAA